MTDKKKALNGQIFEPSLNNDSKEAPNIKREEINTHSAEFSASNNHISIGDQNPNELRRRGQPRKSSGGDRMKLEKMDSRTSEDTDEGLAKFQKAEILCDQLRTGLQQELNDVVKRTVENAVERILERAELEHLDYERNQLRNK